MGREAWQTTVHSKESEMTERLSISLFFLEVLEVIVYIDIPRITYKHVVSQFYVLMNYWDIFLKIKIPIQ